MRIEFLTPGDEEEVKEIFRAQNLNVSLPLPSSDPCVIVAVIGKEGSRVVGAAIGRLTVESHLIIRPDEPAAIHKIKRLSERAHGVVQAEARRMKQLGFAAVSDTFAMVPRDMIRMRKFAGYLGYIEGPSDEKGPLFVEYYKPLSE